MSNDTITISDKDIEKFKKDGAILLKGIFSPEWTEALKTGIQKNKENPSENSENLRSADGGGYYFNDYCNWRQIPEFKEFVTKTGVAELAGKLMHSEYAVFYHEHVLTKDACTYKKTPWHQDQPYYPVDGFKNCSMWIPVDKVDESSTIQFIKGSHNWGKWFHPRKFETSNKYVVENKEHMTRSYEEIPDFDNAHERGYEVLKWACEPGDCVVFHMLTVHGAPANTMASPRRIVSLRWLGDDTVIAARPWKTSPPVYGGLSVGDSVKCDTFPMLWSRAQNGS